MEELNPDVVEIGFTDTPAARFRRRGSRAHERFSDEDEVEAACGVVWVGAMLNDE